MPDDTIAIVLRVNPGSEADEQETSELTQQLRKELLECEVESVEPVYAGELRAGAKGDPVTLGALAVSLAPIVLEGMIKTIQDWLLRHRNVTITVESGDEKVSVTGDPSPAQQRILRRLLTRHGA